MSFDSSPAPIVIPNAQTPKLIGILSIVFGSMLLLGGLCQGISAVFTPMLGNVMEATFKAEQEKIDTQRKTDEAALDAREKSAKTDEEKAKAAADQAAFNAQPKPNLTAMTASFDILKNPVIIAVNVFDMSTSIVLNSLMIAAGIGLLGLKRWGRSLSLWVAGIKIARLFIIATLTITIVAPITLASQKKQFEQIEAQGGANGGGGPPGMKLSDLSKVMAATTYAGTIVYYIVAAIFPSIVLMTLTRPRATAAFVQKAKPITDWDEVR